MSKVIIGIHGLGNKPPKEMLETWWRESICEGLSKINQFYCEPNFELVYWADILNDKPLNELIKDPENPYFLDEPYTPADEIIEHKEHSTRKKVLEFLEDQMDKIFLNDDLSSNYNFVSDLLFKKYFKELEIYYAKQPDVNDDSFKSVKDIIRNRLADVLKKHKNKEIMLIAHSMGTIIAYDVCNFVAPEININTFVTMGSPLGMPIIVSKIAEELKDFDPNIKKLRTPKSVNKAWHNFSDLEDKVAMNYNLADDYEANILNVKVIDNVVENDYQVNDQPNPHKSYGYLRASEFSKLLSNFLYDDCTKFELWRLETMHKMKQFLNKKLFKKGA